MAAAENPIERRLEQLYDHWEALLDKEPARLLCWRVAAHEFRCVEAFFAAEDDERAGQLPVVFLRFEDPFDDPLHYAAVLRGRLLEAIELALAREDEPDPDPDDPPVSLDMFVPPPPTGDTLRDLMATAEALSRRLPVTRSPSLALVLLPCRIADVDAWLVWLRMAAMRTPEPVRLVVFDDPDGQALHPLVEAEPQLVHVEVVEMDLAGAAVEISAEAGNLDRPEGQFRHAYVQMLEAIGKQDIGAAQQHATPALEVASAQGWGHLEIAVVFGLGNGFLQAQQPQRALELYQRAEQRAVQGEQAGESWAGPLRLNARLAMGAAAVMAETWAQAAQLYLETVATAQALEDRRSELDCLRMAAYCRANHGQEHDAWALGLAALALGEAMDDETRNTSTLAHVGVALERLAAKLGAPWRPIEQRFVAALGPNWRPRVSAGAGLESPGREVHAS